MKTQKEIVQDVKWHYDYEVKQLKAARKKYYLEDRNSTYKDIWFDDYRQAKYCVMSLAQILGIYDDVKNRFDIIIGEASL